METFVFDHQNLEVAVDTAIKNPDLFEVALSHSSFSKENNKAENNEKLEFLGDAILDFVLSDLLMKIYSADTEGNLSRKRASIVNEERLAELAKDRGFADLILLGKSEQRNGLAHNPRILSSAFEAVVGAIYKDSGFEAVYAWIEKVFDELLHQAFELHDFEKDYKTRFQEIIQEKYKVTPIYKVLSHEGPDHQKVYRMEVSVKGEVWATGQGQSKKAAAQSAAEEAMKKVTES